MPARLRPSVLHLDLDAFYAAVEQRDKPSLRGRPVVVGGVGPRGVVATASYEARRSGVRSAMATAQARALCPHAAYLSPRFAAYAATSEVVMSVLRALSPLVEPLSLDEAFVDLEAGAHEDLGVPAVTRLATEVKAEVTRRTGMVASVGAATSKLVAKIASDLDKPDGLRVVPPGSEQDLLGPLPVTRLWGVGPATAERLRRLGLTTVSQLRASSEGELVELLGAAHGGALWAQAHARDERPVVAERAAKSVSAEDTFEQDLTEPARLAVELDRLAGRVGDRLHRDGQSGRTVTVKVRRHDFTTLTRSTTLAGPTDDVTTVRRVARRLLEEVDTSGGVRLLGVGVSGLADWAQHELFGPPQPPDPTTEAAALAGAAGAAAEAAEAAERAGTAVPAAPGWRPGADVVHEEHGHGWVWGSGAGRVTVRFETAATGPGPVRTFPADDPRLQPAPPSWAVGEVEGPA